MSESYLYSLCFKKETMGAQLNFRISYIGGANGMRSEYVNLKPGFVFYDNIDIALISRNGDIYRKP